MPPSPQTAKLTSTLHLLIPRLRLLQKKDTASSVVQRRDLANLLENNREASARIRVENVIATDIAIEVMEMVELYCELILARANVLDQLAFGEKGVRARNRAREIATIRRQQQLQQQQQQAAVAGGKPSTSTSSSSFSFRIFGGGKKEPEISTGSSSLDPYSDDGEDSKFLDSALDEAAAAVFYAWTRFPHDVRELTILRGLLTDRYGKDFMTLAQDNKLDEVPVPERLVKGLRVRPPTQELVESYLREIARAYGVAWGQSADDEVDAALEGVPEEYQEACRDDKRDDGDGGDDGLPSTPRRDMEARRASETVELNRATPPRGLQPGKSPVSVAPPGPRSDNPNPRVKVPDDEVSGPNDVSQRGAPKSGKSGGGIPELDELTRRFAALKR